jgi:phage-related protein
MAYVVSGYWAVGYTDTESSAAITGELQGINPTAIIELFQLELNANQHGVNQTYYFHNGTKQNSGNNLVFGGTTYTALPIEADGFAYSGQGSLPRPTLRVSNILSTITALLATLPNGLEGAKVTRLRTLARYIDDSNFLTALSPLATQSGDILTAQNGDVLVVVSQGGNPYGTPDATALFPLEVYYVDRKSTENRNLVEFELASAFDLAGVRAPKRQCISRCQWVYRSAECGYTGTNYFNANDNPVANTSEDVCGKKQSSCEARFGENNELPFGGYPGIGTFFA